MQGCLCWILKYSTCFKKLLKQYSVNMFTMQQITIMNHFLSFPCKYHTLHYLHVNGGIVTMPVLVLLFQGM